MEDIDSSWPIHKLGLSLSANVAQSIFQYCVHDATYTLYMAHATMPWACFLDLHRCFGTGGVIKRTINNTKKYHCVYIIIYNRNKNFYFLYIKIL